MNNWAFFKGTKLSEDYSEKGGCVCGPGRWTHSEMELFPNVLCGWSWEENKQFELALAVVDEQDPDRWEVVASMVGGKKSAEDVQKHYVILLEDLQGIESGLFDHQIGEPQSCTLQVDCVQSACWTDEDHNLLVELNMN